MFSVERVRTRWWLAGGYHSRHRSKNEIVRVAREETLRCEQEPPNARGSQGYRFDAGYRKGLLQAFWNVAVAASGEFAGSHADHDAILGQAVLDRGDDLIRKRNLRIGRRLMLSGSRSWIDSECVTISSTGCRSTMSLMPMMARWGRGPGYVQFPHKTNPEPRKERSSRIWRKIYPQRQAEYEVKRDAG